MARFVSHAYRPQGDAESRSKEMEILRSGFPIILRNPDRILSILVHPARGYWGSIVAAILGGILA